MMAIGEKHGVRPRSLKTPPKDRECPLCHKKYGEHSQQEFLDCMDRAVIRKVYPLNLESARNIRRSYRRPRVGPYSLCSGFLVEPSPAELVILTVVF